MLDSSRGLTSLIIPTYDRSVDLSRCLDSILCLRRSFDEIVIVEQGDIENTRRIVNGYIDLKIRVLFHPTRSLTQARNVGVRAAQGDFIFFVDDDTILDPDYVSAALHHFECNPKVVGITGKILGRPKARGAIARVAHATRWFLTYSLRVLFQAQSITFTRRVLSSGHNTGGSEYPTGIACYDKWLSAEHDVEWLSGGHCCFRRVVFDGGLWFEPDFISWSWKEDILFSYQVFGRYGRGSLKYVPSFSLTHLESTQSRIASAPRIRMQIVYNYIFWRETVYSGSLLELAAFIWGQMWVLLVFGRREPKNVLVCLSSYLFLISHWRRIDARSVDYNKYIFSE